MVVIKNNVVIIKEKTNRPLYKLWFFCFSLFSFLSFKLFLQDIEDLMSYLLRLVIVTTSVQSAAALFSGWPRNINRHALSLLLFEDNTWILSSNYCCV